MTAEPEPHPVVRLRVSPPELELAELALWELGATGLEEQDQATLSLAPNDGRVVVIASFESDAMARRAIEALQEHYDAVVDYLPATDWRIEWRRGLGPQTIGERLLIQPSWIEPSVPEARAVVTIDPENAFGSGDHESTRLVLDVIERRVRGGERILDVGCGSGILSIAALKLGAASARGVDIEPDAVVAARRNADLNGVGRRFVVSTDPLETVDGEHDLVFANIETKVLRTMSELLPTKVGARGLLVLSGILREECDAIVDCYRAVSLEEILDQGSWCALVFRPEAG